MFARRMMETPSLFTPEQLVPEQLVRALRRTPSQRLAIAVISRAWDDLAGRYAPLPPPSRYRLTVRRAPAPHETARAWFLSDDRSWPFAFLVLCDHFGWDAETVRRKLA